MVTDQFPGQDDDDVDISRGPVSIEKLRGRYFDEATGTFRKPVSPEEANAEFMAMLARGAEENAEYCERNGPAMREAYEKEGAAGGSEYRAALRLLEGVRKGVEDPQETREWIINWKRSNRITRVQMKKLLEQLDTDEDAERELPEPVRRCPPPKVLQKMPSPTFVKLMREMGKDEEDMRHRIEQAARAGLLRKGEKGILLCQVDRIMVSGLHGSALAKNKKRDELFVEGPMDTRGEAQKPQLFRRPVAGEKKTHAPAHLRNGDGAPKPLKTVHEGLTIVNGGPRGIGVFRPR